MNIVPREREYLILIMVEYEYHYIMHCQLALLGNKCIVIILLTFCEVSGSFVCSIHQTHKRAKAGGLPKRERKICT